jgi:5,6,7,8-tetrahydromethanopterin hydro-lyase
MAADFFLGESLVGDGNEVAPHRPDHWLEVGSRGRRVCERTRQQQGRVSRPCWRSFAPNLPCKPDTLLFNKVTIKGAKQAVQMFGPAQAAVARAVVDSVANGTIDKNKANDLCILVGVFIHWEAADDTKIFDYNYKATMESIARALGGKPTVDDVLAGAKSVKHPFSPK